MSGILIVALEKVLGLDMEDRITEAWMRERVLGREYIISQHAGDRTKKRRPIAFRYRTGAIEWRDD